MENSSILEKWAALVYAAKAYWIDSVPTGMDDATFDLMEKQALEKDGFSVRDYVFQTYMQGNRVENKYIEKIKKTKVEGKTMLQALQEKQKELGKKLYADLKYDGSSIAIYLNPETGIPQKLVTVGNLNITGAGIEQTGKLYKFLPPEFPKGIVAIQCEALIDLDNLPPGLDPEKARQKANGLINSKYAQEEVDRYLTLRAYRYYLDTSTPAGCSLEKIDYREVLGSFQTVQNEYGIKFAAADVFSVDDLETGFPETDRTRTSTGMFLNDGWVMYDSSGHCLGALKYSGAGSESDGIIKTTVRGIKWNDQNPKGKDSWSANVLIDPVIIHGSKVTKPSAGSVGKLVKNNISPGATVSIILANSTIPMVGECFGGGSGDFQFPTCSCGYKMSEEDVYGSRLKCGNIRCSVREKRMVDYLETLSGNIGSLDLGKLLVIDGFDWSKTDIDLRKLIGYVTDNADIVAQDLPDPRIDYFGEFRGYLMSYMNTPTRQRNLDLVVQSAWYCLWDYYYKCAYDNKFVWTW